MEERLPCERHDEQIKILFQKLEKVEDDRTLMFNLDKNMAIQTQMLQEMISQNEKRDKAYNEQHKTIIKINTNLTELNEGQKALNRRVGKLEERVEKNEEKHKVDTRDINQKGMNDILYTILYKIAIPVSFLAFLSEKIIKYFK